jgi:hypothetical protein
VVANAAFGRHDPVYHMPKNVGVRERAESASPTLMSAAI